jgi:7-cyano-7-deazaguanine synthase in queuosine biosynthesis
MTDYTKLGFIPFEQVLDEAKEGVDSLIVASGGLDSAYILWKYHQVAKNKPVHVNHIRFYPTFSKRIDAETQALNNQCKYLNNEVIVHKTTLDFESEGLRLSLGRDFHLAALLSTQIAFYKKLKYVVIGDEILDGFLRKLPDSILPKDARHEDQLFAIKDYFETSTFGKVKLSLNMSRSDVLEEYLSMPRDYMALSFSCREPDVNQFSAKACGECMSCHRNALLGIRQLVCKQVIFEERI